MAQLRCIPQTLLKTSFVATMSIFMLLAMVQATHAGSLSKWVTGTMANFTLLPKPLPVPVITFRDGKGQKRTMADFAGKVVLVNFWATWCGPCRREMPDLDKLQALLGGSEFVVVAISSDRKGLEAVQEFYQEKKVRNLEIFIDTSTKAQRMFGAYGLPTSVLVDARGQKIGHLVGPAEWASADAVALIRMVIVGGGS